MQRKVTNNSRPRNSQQKQFYLSNFFLSTKGLSWPKYYGVSNFLSEEHLPRILERKAPEICRNHSRSQFEIEYFLFHYKCLLLIIYNLPSLKLQKWQEAKGDPNELQLRTGKDKIWSCVVFTGAKETAQSEWSPTQESAKIWITSRLTGKTRKRPWVVLRACWHVQCGMIYAFIL